MKNGARKLLLPLGDIAMLFGAFFIMLQFAFPGGITEDLVESHLPPFLFIFSIWLLIFFLFNLYDSRSIKPTIPNLQKIGGSYLIALTASIVLFYTVPYFGITPKTNLVIFSTVFIILFMVWRRIFYKIFSVNFRKNVAMLMDPGDTSARELINYIEIYPESGFSIKGIYSSPAELLEKIDALQIDTIIVSREKFKDTKEAGLIYNKVKDIFDFSFAYEEILGKIPVESIDESWFLYNIRKSDKTPYYALSGALNALAATLGLIVASPILFIAALLIKFSDGGPIFYAQDRVGKQGKIFRLYKLRSMKVGADKNGAEWTEKNDPRITAVGAIIRKLHIDEIPQLWNVLRREMALVGPRPEIPSFAQKLENEIKHYNLRHIIPPGFTGWAQIKFRNARGVLESKEKFEYDLYYIKNRNIFMDLGIIVRTIVIIFSHD